jgi:hypothetical protein
MTGTSSVLPLHFPDLADGGFDAGGVVRPEFREFAYPTLPISRTAASIRCASASQNFANSG